MADYEVESSAVTHEGVLSTVRVDRVRMPADDVAEREIVEHANAVGVVVLDQDGQVVLLRQYRHAVQDRLLEIPAGKLDVEGETPEQAARRELIEEVGLAAGVLTPLLAFHNSAGWSDEVTTIYLTTDATPEQAPQDFAAVHEEADLEVVRMPIAEAVAKVVAGEISDAKTVIGLLLADRRMSDHETGGSA